MSAVVIVPKLLIVAPLKLIVPEAVKLVTVAAAAALPPIVVPSIAPPLISKFVPVTSTDPASNI